VIDGVPYLINEGMKRDSPQVSIFEVAVGLITRIQAYGPNGIGGCFCP